MTALVGLRNLPARVREERRRTPPPRTPAFVVITALVLVLTVLGLTMVLSASAVRALRDYGSSWYFFGRQAIWALLGVAAFFACARVDYRRWRRIVPVLVLVSLALLVVVLLPGIGIEVDGGRRWLGSGPVRFQPSELAKLAFILFMADLLTRRSADVLRHPGRLLLHASLGCGVLAALVLLEPDLDSTVVLGVVFLAMLAVAGIPGRPLLGLAGAATAMAALLAFAVPYRRARVMTLFQGGGDASNAGYQIAQSLIALGSGGIDGVGAGAGRAKWMFLPNAHTDFIFAVIGEEFGFFGCMIVLGMFAGFGLAGFRVARLAPDRFGTLLAAGITTWIVAQAFINLGAVTGILPVSGITLPFLSAGGSSLVFTMTGAGILANIARQVPTRRPAPR